MIQEFAQEINNKIKKGISNIHTAMPGTITAFDPGSGLATVVPSMKFKKPNGETMDYPQITGVPVVFPQGAGQSATVAFPVKAGDGCLIIISEQSLDYWMYGQETDTSLAFDLTNAICIPGMFAKGNSAMQEACSSNSIVIEAAGTKVKVGQNAVQIDAAIVTINGNVRISGSLSHG